MKKMKFSVAMCVYKGDKAEFFDEALASVYNQTRRPDEVVLTVDGPVPDSIEDVITKYVNREGLTVCRLEKNMGHGVARRTGLSHCSYDYVAIADADDINVPTRFERQMALFETNPQLDAVSSGCYHFVDTIDEVLYEEFLPETDVEIKKFLKRRCPLCQASTMFRKSKVEEAGGYMDWYHAEDYYLWIRMYLCGAVFQNTKESLLYVRSSPDYVNRRGGWKYFKSLARLFGYMYKHKVIGLSDYLFNVSSRFVAQVLLPTSLRGWLRKVIDK